MASSFFLPLLHRPVLPLIGLSAAVPVAFALHHPSSPFRSPQSTIHCQYTQPHTPADSHWSFPSGTLRTNNTASRWGHISPATAKQISLGSVLGVGLGMTLRIFSKALVLAFGLGILVVQFAASKGYNIIPIHRLQKYVKSVDLQRAMTENVAFKSSFGLTMALAAVAQF